MRSSSIGCRTSRIRLPYIDAKEQFYEAVLDGTTPYVSNVLGLEE